MPSKSKKQHNLMALVANDPKAAKRLGIPKSVGEEFMKADKGKKFGKGGYAAGGCATKADAKSIAKKEVKGHEKSMHKMKKGGSITEKGTGEKYASKAAMMRHEKKESKAQEAKEHGKVKRMFAGGMGGFTFNENSKRVPDKPSAAAQRAKPALLAKKNDVKAGMARMARASGVGMKEGGMCGAKKMARGGGIEKKGKTKGKVI